MDRKWLLVLAFTVLIQPLNAEECDSPEKGFDISRLFYGWYEGEDFNEAERSTFITSLGECNTINHVNAMIQYFASYGVNVSRIREQPFTSYDGDGYTLGLYAALSQEKQFRLTSGLYDGYTQYLNAPFHWGEWDLTAKRDMRGPRGSLEKDKSIFFGVDGFRINGQTYCVQYNSKNPLSEAYYESDVQASDVEAYHEIWGKGDYNALSQYINDTVHSTFILLFPSDPPQ